MIQERAALAESEARSERCGDEFLGAAHRTLEVTPVREISRDGRRECASGAVRLTGDAFSFQREETTAVVK